MQNPKEREIMKMTENDFCRWRLDKQPSSCPQTSRIRPRDKHDLLRKVGLFV